MSLRKSPNNLNLNGIMKDQIIPTVRNIRDLMMEYRTIKVVPIPIYNYREKTTIQQNYQKMSDGPKH